MRQVLLPQRQMYCGPLALVNRRHPLQTADRPDLIPLDGTCPQVLLERQTAKLLLACIQAAGGAGAIVPVSGWRSSDEQQRIWDDSMAADGPEFTRQFVALPGCSEHQTGLAIDLGRAARHIDFIRPHFPYSGVCGAFRRAALRYGFVERYPAGKDAVTGIAHEPWHFRYVGAPHAQRMAELGLCLEEYLELLRSEEQCFTLDNGRSVRVFHIPCTGAVTAAELPGGCCQISGDNVDGFIVTAWGGRA